MTGTQNPTPIGVDAQIGHWRILNITHKRALARCRCGAVHEVSVAALEDGTSTSCGCARPTTPRIHAIHEAKKERERQKLFNWKLERGR